MKEVYVITGGNGGMAEALELIVGKNYDRVLTSVDRRALSFQVRVYDATGEIATAEHNRFVVDAQRFQAKADAKA